MPIRGSFRRKLRRFPGVVAILEDSEVSTLTPRTLDASAIRRGRVPGLSGDRSSPRVAKSLVLLPSEVRCFVLVFFFFIDHLEGDSSSSGRLRPARIVNPAIRHLRSASGGLPPTDDAALSGDL